jgi:hypothetical protein
LQSAPRRSARLAKKACGRTPAVVAAQNILLRKLGIAQEHHLESSHFEAYLSLFKEGLSEEQVHMIKELFQGAVSDAFLDAAEVQ